MWQAKIKLAASKSQNNRLKISKNSLWEAWLECQENKDAERFVFFLAFKDSEGDWRPWTDGVFEKLLRSFVISHVSDTTASASLSRLCFQKAAIYFIFNSDSCLLVGTAGGERGSWATVRLRTAGKTQVVKSSPLRPPERFASLKLMTQ